MFKDHNFKFLISNSTIDTIRFWGNKFFISLKIINIKANTPDLFFSKFYSSPILFKDDVKNIGQLNLAKKNEFIFLFYPKLNSIRNFFTLSKDRKRYITFTVNMVWEEQYRRFREMYNIAKMRDMYTEQSDYFSLMQHCLRKTSGISVALKFFSYVYHTFSDYGQNIARPLISIFGLFITCTLIFMSLGVEKVNAPYLSLTQILKPYSMLYDREPRLALNKLCNNGSSIRENNQVQNESKNIEETTCLTPLTQYKYGWLLISTSVLESTFSLIFLTCLILALRWNFRKA